MYGLLLPDQSVPMAARRKACTWLDCKEANIHCRAKPWRAENLGDNIRYRELPAGKEERMMDDIKRALLGDHEAAQLTHLSLFSGMGCS